MADELPPHVKAQAAKALNDGQKPAVNSYQSEAFEASNHPGRIETYPDLSKDTDKTPNKE